MIRVLAVALAPLLTTTTIKHPVKEVFSKALGNQENNVLSAVGIVFFK